jgi:DNA polymerase-3 subunit alpha
MGAVKNVGAGPVGLILTGRRAGEQDHPFSDLNDFARRVDLRAAGKRALECLVKVGALDALGDRAAVLASLDRIVAASTSHFRAIESGQMSLFGAATGVQAESISLPANIQTDKKEALTWERELMGLYLSDHPLKAYEEFLKKGVSHNAITLNDAGHQQPCRVAGMVVSSRPYKTKTDKMMGFVTLEDMQGNIELVIFPKTWGKFRPLCEEGKVILAVGKVDATTTPPKVLVDEIRTDLTVFVSVDSEHSSVPVSVPAPRQAIPSNNFQRGLNHPQPVSPSRQPVSQPRPIAAAPSANTTIPTAQTPKQSPVPQRIAEPPADYVPAPDDDFDGMPPEPDFPENWEMVETAPVYAAAPPTPMDDMLEMERLSPVIDAPAGADNSVSAPAPQPVAEPAPVIAVQTAVAQPEALPEKRSAPLPPIIPPAIVEQKDDGQPPRIITLFLRPSGDPERDRRRIKNIYFILMSQPGKDRFQFQVFEGGKGHLIDFPNDTTRISQEMLERLKKLIGEENWRIEEITYQ